MTTTKLIFSATLALLLCSASPLPLRAQDQAQSQSTFTFRVNSDVVLTNVVVRDRKTGQPVLGLAAKDFTILEDGKRQQISSFDFENVDQAAALNEATISGTAQNNLFRGNGTTATEEALHDRRLIVMFFDLTSMQPEDLLRSQESARHYIEHQMQPADLVAVVSLDSALTVNQDFTSDKELLLRAVGGYSGAQGLGYELGATSTTNQVEDTTSFTPDEEEYNDLNTDRELFAIEDISKSLAWINEKKSMLYFSGGIQRDGIENQASLNAAVNAAVRSNMSIYSVDARGLQAISPLGDASTGSLRGISAYNGSALQNNMDSNFNTQEVMATLSSDTGGKAFFDSNDFSDAFRRIQNDTAAYYIVGYRSTDTRRDGTWRRLTIKVDRKDVKLDYRPGYYAPADFRHSNKEQREQELEDELASPLPATDIEVYLQAWYFEQNPGRFYIPVSLVVPGSQIPFVQGADRDKATLDIIGQIRDLAGHDVGDVHDTVKLAVDASQHVRQKNVQYTTGFALPPGKYELKFVVRENETGRMGSFEAQISVPDLDKAPLKMSSVVLASQRVPAGKKLNSPLVYDGDELVPNLPHVFSPDQTLTLLYQVYDPAQVSGKQKAAGPTIKDSGPPVSVFTSVELLRDNEEVFAAPVVRATKTNMPGLDGIAFHLNVPLGSLTPGTYICQVNVIDDARGSFSFPRTAIVIRGATAPVPSSTPDQAPSRGSDGGNSAR
ncbi:MAG TPA: VWA domain-containing protein [Terracidiphilus sp.]|nr:VWA domain-containing protein [Terracidiphilus sp.]